MRRVTAVILAMAAVAACSVPSPAVSPPRPPSEAAALAFLDVIVAIVRRGELDRLCELGGGNCARHLDEAAWSAPRIGPRVVGSVDVPIALNADGTWTGGGRLLMLCGLDGLGAPYYSEMLVFEDRGRLIAIEPVFWTGLRIDTMPAITRAAGPEPCPVP